MSLLEEKNGRLKVVLAEAELERSILRELGVENLCALSVFAGP